MMLLQLLLDNVEILCIYKMERSATTVEQLFLDFSMEKFNSAMLNVKCEIWSIPLRQWSCVLISTCRFTWLPLKSFLHSLSRLFLFPHQVWILEQLSTPLCSEQVKKYERHDAKTKGSANQQIWWLSTKKFDSPLPFQPPPFSHIFLHFLVFMWKYTKDLIVQF